MKSAKKILALILAGVMALALLTGCGKATSLNRTIAEGLAVSVKSFLAGRGNTNNISVSYQVPELSRDIAPLFDENWITKDDKGHDVLNENYKVNGNRTVEATLGGILMSSYMSAARVKFAAADVTDVKTPFMEVENLLDSRIGFSGTNPSLADASITSIRIAVVHKNVNSRTYALVMIICYDHL